MLKYQPPSFIRIKILKCTTTVDNVAIFIGNVRNGIFRLLFSHEIFRNYSLLVFLMLSKCIASKERIVQCDFEVDFDENQIRGFFSMSWFYKNSNSVFPSLFTYEMKYVSENSRSDKPEHIFLCAYEVDLCLSYSCNFERSTSTTVLSFKLCFRLLDNSLKTSEAVESLFFLLKRLSELVAKNSGYYGTEYEDELKPNIYVKTVISSQFRK